MKDKAFFDTNMLMYLYSNDDDIKKAACRETLKNFIPIISTQVINELCNIFTKKLKLPATDIARAISKVTSFFHVETVDLHVISYALKLYSKFGYSYFDCLMLSSAILSGCKHIITEDMQDEHNVDGVIINNIFRGL